MGGGNCSLQWTLIKFWIVILVFISLWQGTPAEQILYPPQFSKNRVVGGSDADPGSFPYQVSLQKNKSHFCGGAIIDKHWILTAAHCLKPMKVEEVTVFTGATDLKDPMGTYYQPSRFIIHCNYNNPPYGNDVGLIYLSQPIQFDNVTKAIECDREPLKAGAVLKLTGWGRTSAGSSLPIKLQVIDLKVITYKQCAAMHGNNSFVDVGHVCTLNKNGEGACNGDSGGPLINTATGKLSAFVNWGVPCAKAYPDVHGSCAFYFDFLRTHIQSGTKCLK